MIAEWCQRPEPAVSVLVVEKYEPELNKSERKDV